MAIDNNYMDKNFIFGINSTRHELYAREAKKKEVKTSLKGISDALDHFSKDPLANQISDSFKNAWAGIKSQIRHKKESGVSQKIFYAVSGRNMSLEKIDLKILELDYEFAEKKALHLGAISKRKTDACMQLEREQDLKEIKGIPITKEEKNELEALKSELKKINNEYLQAIKDSIKAQSYHKVYECKTNAGEEAAKTLAHDLNLDFAEYLRIISS